MRARIRDTEIYFDVDGAGLVADGPRMRESALCPFSQFALAVTGHWSMICPGIMCGAACLFMGNRSTNPTFK